MFMRLCNVLCVAMAIMVGNGAARAAKPDSALAEELAQVESKIELSATTTFYDNPKFPPDTRNKALRPLRKRKIELIRQLTASNASRDEGEYAIDLQLAHLAGEGDSSSKDELDKAASSSDAKTAASAKLGQAMAAWWTEPTPEIQEKVMADLLSQAHANPADQWLAFTLVAIADHGALTPKLGVDARNTVAKTMTSKYARGYAVTPNKLNWPLVINGTTPQGKQFSSAAWKGKVVMVDFWATWCPPCIAELPSVIETYNKYHDQGFEIIGVSNDTDRQELTQFLRGRSAIKWPQLFGPSSSSNHWHTLTEKFGVNSIPRVYLIDRDGILRSVTARGQLEDLVPKLLAESPDPARAAMMANWSPNAAGASKLTPAATPSVATPPVATGTAPPAIAPPAAAPPAADDSKLKAARTLQLAKNYINAEHFDQARAKLQSIIATYPQTPATTEAKTLLKEIEGK